MPNANGLKMNASVTTVAPSLVAEGTDTNVDLQLSAQGTGKALLGNTGTATATAGAATSNTQRGTITTEALTIAAGADYTLTLTNSKVSASSQVFVEVDNGTNTTAPVYKRLVTPGAGSVVIIIRNAGAVALNGTLKISYLVV